MYVVCVQAMRTCGPVRKTQTLAQTHTHECIDRSSGRCWHNRKCDVHSNESIILHQSAYNPAVGVCVCVSLDCGRASGIKVLHARTELWCIYIVYWLTQQADTRTASA